MPLNQSFKSLITLLSIIMILNVSVVMSAEDDAINGRKLKLLSAGDTAPINQLKGLDNQIYTFPVSGCWNMIFYWSLFCHSCVEEMPIVQARLEELASSTLKVHFVSLDSERMQKALENFCKRRDLKQTVLMEQLASESYFTADQWGVTMTPSVFIVAPDGKIAYSHQGPVDLEKFFNDFSGMTASEQVKIGE